jgi:hypothetical protein
VVALACQLCNTPLERPQKKVGEGQKLNGPHQLLVYADVNLLDRNTNTIKKNELLTRR